MAFPGSVRETHPLGGVRGAVRAELWAAVPASIPRASGAAACRAEPRAARHTCSPRLAGPGRRTGTRGAATGAAVSAWEPTRPQRGRQSRPVAPMWQGRGVGGAQGGDSRRGAKDQDPSGQD